MSCHVYAKCWSGRRRYLQVLHTARTRSQAQEWVNRRAREGGATHYLIVSSLDQSAATRRYMDGATWDELACCWID